MIDLFKLGVTLTLTDKTGPSFQAYIDTVAKASKATDVLIDRLDALKLKMATIGGLGVEMGGVEAAALAMGQTVSAAMNKITTSTREARAEASALARTVRRAHAPIGASHRLHAGVAGGIGSIFGIHEARKAMGPSNDMLSMWANLQMTSPNKDFAKSLWKVGQREFNRNPILTLSHTIGLGGEIYRATGEKDPAALQGVLRQTLRLATILTESAHIRNGHVDEGTITREVRAFPRLLDLLNVFDPKGIKRVADIFGSVMSVYGTDFDFQRFQKTIFYMRGLGMINSQKDLFSILPQLMIESGRSGGGSSGGVAPGMVSFAQLFSGKAVTKRTAALWQQLGLLKAGVGGPGGSSILDSIGKGRSGGLLGTTTTSTQVDPTQLNKHLAMLALVHPVRFGAWLLKGFEKMNPKLGPAMSAARRGDQSDATKEQLAWLFQHTMQFTNNNRTAASFMMDVMMKQGLGRMARFRSLIAGKGAMDQEQLARQDPFIKRLAGKHSAMGPFMGELFLPLAQDLMVFWDGVKKVGQWFNTFASDHPKLMQGMGKVLETAILALVTEGFGLVVRAVPSAVALAMKSLPGLSKSLKPLYAMTSGIRHLWDAKFFKMMRTAGIFGLPWASEFFSHATETHPYQFGGGYSPPSSQPVHLIMDGQKVGEAFIKRLTDSMQYPTIPLGGTPYISFTPMGH